MYVEVALPCIQVTSQLNLLRSSRTLSSRTTELSINHPVTKNLLRRDWPPAASSFQSGFTSTSHRGTYSNAYLSASLVELISCALSFCLPQLASLFNKFPLSAAWGKAHLAPGGMQYLLKFLPHFPAPVWRLSAFTFRFAVMACFFPVDTGFSE